MTSQCNSITTPTLIRPVPGKLLANLLSRPARHLTRDNDNDPMLTVGQFKAVLLGGMLTILGIVLSSYVQLTVLVTQFSEFKGRDAQEKVEINQRLDGIEESYSGLKERVIKLEND